MNRVQCKCIAIGIFVLLLTTIVIPIEVRHKTSRGTYWKIKYVFVCSVFEDNANLDYGTYVSVYYNRLVVEWIVITLVFNFLVILMRDTNCLKRITRKIYIKD